MSAPRRFSHLVVQVCVSMWDSVCVCVCVCQEDGGGTSDQFCCPQRFYSHLITSCSWTQQKHSWPPFPPRLSPHTGFLDFHAPGRDAEDGWQVPLLLLLPFGIWWNKSTPLSGTGWHRGKVGWLDRLECRRWWSNYTNWDALLSAHIPSGPFSLSPQERCLIFHIVATPHLRFNYPERLMYVSKTDVFCLICVTFVDNLKTKLIFNRNCLKCSCTLNYCVYNLRSKRKSTKN